MKHDEYCIQPGSAPARPPERSAAAAVFEMPEINLEPGDRYASHHRNWQGVPAIERAANGRLWVTWYSGGQREDNENYVLLATSEDDGATWSEPVAVVDPPGMVRAWDPNLWHDPNGRLWWSWTQSCPMPGEAWDGIGGIWVAACGDSECATPTWSEPRRIAHGVSLNKPIVLSNGDWVWPRSIWWMFEQFKDLDSQRKPGVIVSQDQGVSWHWRGGATLDERVFDEPMVVELRDGTLWMLMRTRTGISESFSMDGGVSWSHARPSRLAGPSSRFYLRRLASGRLLLINHLGNPDRQRSRLTAMLSDDDGWTWPHRLLLDERVKVTYPDAVEGPDGTLRIVYDFDRYGEKEILMARVTEADIVAGKAVDSQSSLKMLVDKATLRENGVGKGRAAQLL